LHGKTLKKPLKKNPDVAIGKCGNDAGCIAKLGKTAGAAHVLYGRVSPDGAGVKAQFIVINVASKELVGRVEISITAAAAAAPEVKAKLAELFPGTSAPAASSESEEIPLDMVLAPEPETTETVAAAPTEAAEELPLDLALADPTSGPTEASPAETATPEEPAATSTPITEIAAISPELSTPVAPPPETGGRSRVLTYVGIAVAGLGAGGLGTGAFFGARSRSLADSIDRGAGGTTQLDARRIQEDSDAAVNLANIMFGVGGGLVAVGAGLIVYDLAIGGDNAPSTSITIGDGGAAATLTWRW
jgi:hypothetical protein